MAVWNLTACNTDWIVVYSPQLVASCYPNLLSIAKPVLDKLKTNLGRAEILAQSFKTLFASIADRLTVSNTH